MKAISKSILTVQLNCNQQLRQARPSQAKAKTNVSTDLNECMIEKISDTKFGEDWSNGVDFYTGHTHTHIHKHTHTQIQLYI